MILKTIDLYEMQERLDEHIFEQHQLLRSETSKRRILALLVELGELANETRCFKFWSTKGSSEKHVVLEEYVDGIHFLLSIGIDLDHCMKEIKAQDVHKDLSEMFMDVYELSVALRKDASAERYEQLFSYYLTIANALQFSAEDIRSAYFAKNQENHKRQERKY